MSQELREIRNPDRLAALRRLKLLDTRPEEPFDRLTRLVAYVLQVPIVQISLIDSDRQFFKSKVGMLNPLENNESTPLSHSFCKYVVNYKQPFVTSDARNDPLLRDNPAIEDYDVIAYAGVPLITSDGYAIGSFCAVDSRPREWTDGDLKVIEEMASSCMAEIELRYMANKLASVNERLEMFGQLIAHDFKLPLSRIVMHSSLMAQHAEQYSERERDHLQTITSVAMEMSNGLNDLLDLARMTDSDQARQIDMNALVSTVLMRLEGDIQRCDALIEVEPDFPRAHGYSEWVAEMMSNLIGNALRFAGARERAKLIISAKPAPGKMVRYSVTDNGPGISSDDAAGLFLPFMRGRSKDDGVHHGLGLFLVKSLATYMGGEVGIESELGEGSTFWFTLPGID